VRDTRHEGGEDTKSGETEPPARGRHIVQLVLDDNSSGGVIFNLQSAISSSMSPR
jgi:hypothetical protein